MGSRSKPGTDSSWLRGFLLAVSRTVEGLLGLGSAEGGEGGAAGGVASKKGSFAEEGDFKKEGLKVSSFWRALSGALADVLW